MFPSKALLSLLFISLSSVDASPVSRQSGKGALRFATRINERGIRNIADNDRARAQALRQAGQLGKRDGSLSVSVTNAGVNYVADVGVGNPSTTYSLLIDTGSSNTFVGVNKAYTPTSTSQDTGNTVSVSYGSGSWSGEEYTDTVTLSSELVIAQQSIGVASQSHGFSGVDGILGVGPVDLTSGTVQNTNTVPTVLDNLLSQGTIAEEVLGVYFIPAADKADDGNGELTFGGYDSSVITGSVQYVPLTTTSPASTYWGVDQSVTYGGQTILSTTAGIVDTGTTLILLATDAYKRYQSLTGGVLDSATNLLKITTEQYNKLQPLIFNIGSTSYSLSPNGQIWPRSLNTAIGGTPDGIYLVVSDAGTPSGQGLDFLNGYTFLERFYTIYDATNGRVGFAATAFTDSNLN